MDKPLEDIDEYNDRRYKNYLSQHGTGIACPRCQSELIFDGTEILTSNPPRRRVKCMYCSYNDTVFA